MLGFNRKFYRWIFFLAFSSDLRFRTKIKLDQDIQITLIQYIMKPPDAPGWDLLTSKSLKAIKSWSLGIIKNWIWTWEWCKLRFESNHRSQKICKQLFVDQYQSPLQSFGLYLLIDIKHDLKLVVPCSNWLTHEEFY